ncbi:MAG: chromosome segregation protein SMC [Hyphomicrobiales bacterium]|nr:MAG: chromosome segregation protein SMC [Hyphomicrobiales bacterium]
MRFSKLRLLGFKSFVEPTDFVIESGLTGVVGPNGCGKSNLVEALRWVMGESSYKAMRASGMDDVIFGGSHNRPARNTAEVTVMLERADGRVPSGLPDAEILEITRRIEREAGSVYKINGKDVRARDVQLLFADASTGARSPAMVRQGQIGELIAAKPTSRRAILEEAAGISGLHTRRHEAELRLRAAEQNLDRLEDVLGELGSQLDGLKRQARQATRYRTLSAEIRKADATILYLRWMQAKKAVGEAEQALAAEAKRVAEQAEVQARTAKDQAVAAHELTARREAEAKASAALQRLRLALGELDAEDARIKERIADLGRRLEQFAADVGREERLIADNREALARLGEEEKALNSDEATARDKGAEATAALQAAEQQLTASEKQFSDLTEESAQLTARRGHLQRTIRDAETRIERLKGQVADIERDLAGLADALARETGVAEKQAAVEAAQAQVGEAEAAADAAEHRIDAAREAEAAARAPVSDAEKQLNAIEAEAAALERLLAQGMGGRWRPIVEAMRVRSGYEKALGAALGADLEAPTDDEAPIHWTDTGTGDGDPALPAGATPLSDYVEAPAALRRRLRQIGLVEAAEGERLHADLAPGQRLVTKDGRVWRWDGLVASADAPSAAAERLAQKNRLEELRAEGDDAGRELARHRAAHEDTKTALQQASEAERAAREALRQSRHAADAARDALSRAEKAMGELVARRSALEEARLRLASSLEEAETAHREAVAALAELPPLEGTEQRLAATRLSVQEQRAAVAEARSVVNGLAREGDIRRARLQAIAAERRSWTSRAESAEHQIATLRERKGEAEAELAAIRETPDTIDTRRKALFREVEGAETNRAAAADALAESERRQVEVDRQAKDALADLSSCREARARAEERLNAARERVTDAVERIDETLECKPEEAAELAELKPGAEPPDVNAVETRLDRLRQERDRLGGVNLRAEEEAREVAERRDVLVTERDDLVEAIKRLRQGIYSLNREARERLVAAFDRVNAHFQELFTHLFGGGTAELQLVDSDDPLEAGLEIVARPPGKKPQTMTLLSGGEQALTAMALIFAVFLTNPAPICVLDEVDAPLDDANVERYCNLLDEMSRRTDTRFVIVTHNPITMARMNRLFGVTMSERGVSQLVSVDLATAEQYREVG